jgi:hypothetical protein
MFNPFDPSGKFTGVRIPRYTAPSLALPANYKLADTFYEQIRVHIEAMQKKLKKNEQLLIYHYCPSGQPILVTNVGFQNPSMIVLHGLDSMGNECCVLTHMTSVQLVVRVMKVDAQAKHRKIGFLHKISPVRS